MYLQRIIFLGFVYKINAGWLDLSEKSYEDNPDQPEISYPRVHIKTEKLANSLEKIMRSDISPPVKIMPNLTNLAVGFEEMGENFPDPSMYKNLGKTLGLMIDIETQKKGDDTIKENYVDIKRLVTKKVSKIGENVLKNVAHSKKNNGFIDGTEKFIIGDGLNDKGFNVGNTAPMGESQLLFGPESNNLPLNQAVMRNVQYPSFHRQDFAEDNDLSLNEGNTGPIIGSEGQILPGPKRLINQAHEVVNSDKHPSFRRKFVTEDNGIYPNENTDNMVKKEELTLRDVLRKKRYKLDSAYLRNNGALKDLNTNLPLINNANIVGNVGTIINKNPLNKEFIVGTRSRFENENKRPINMHLNNRGNANSRLRLKAPFANNEGYAINSEESILLNNAGKQVIKQIDEYETPALRYKGVDSQTRYNIRRYDKDMNNVDRTRGNGVVKLEDMVKNEDGSLGFRNTENGPAPMLPELNRRKIIENPYYESRYNEGQENNMYKFARKSAVNENIGRSLRRSGNTAEVARRQDQFNINPERTKFQSGQSATEVESSDIMKAINDFVSSNAVDKYTDDLAGKAAVVYKTLLEKLKEDSK